MEKTVWKAKLVHVYRDIMDSWDENPFRDIEEAQIDEKGHVIKNVCVFGTRFSKNGYTYQDKAIESLHRFTNGTKFFINHPSKSEAKERDGVRDIRDWAGVFSAPRKEGEKVYADLNVRPAFWELVKDVAIMKPAGVGNSINSRVKVFKDDKGKEQVVDIENLKSIDLVASAATTQNLFESAHDKAEIQLDNRLDEIFSEADNREDLIFQLVADVSEGILADKIDLEKRNRKIRDVQYQAEDVIRWIIEGDKEEYKNMDMVAKRKAISGVLDDLEAEIGKIMSGKVGTESTTIKERKKEEETMDWSKLTLEDIQKEKPELIKAIQDSMQKTEKVKAMETENVTLKKTNEDMAKELTTLKAQVENMTKELTDAKKKLDEYETKTKASKKEAFIDAQIQELKVPKDAITEFFRKDLMNKEEKEIVEALKDRRELYLAGPKPKNIGEHVWTGDGDGDKEMTKEKKEAAAGKLLNAVKR